MAKDNLLLIGALALGGYLLYKKSLNTAIPGGILPAPVIPPGSNGVITPGLLSAAPADTMTAATGVSNPGDNVILNWFQSLSPANAQQALSQWPNMTTADKAGLYDLIANDWQGGQGNTPARIAFWNSWRVKYHVNDGTYP